MCLRSIIQGYQGFLTTQNRRAIRFLIYQETRFQALGLYEEQVYDLLHDDIRLMLEEAGSIFSKFCLLI